MGLGSYREIQRLWGTATWGFHACRQGVAMAFPRHTFFFCWVGKTPRFNNQSGVVNVFEVEVLCSTLSWMTLISSQRGGGSTSWFLQGFCSFAIGWKLPRRRSMTSAFRRTPMIVISIANVARTDTPVTGWFQTGFEVAWWYCTCMSSTTTFLCGAWITMIFAHFAMYRRNPSLSPQDVYNVQPAIDIWLLIHCTQTGFHPGHETHWLVSVETCRKVHSQTCIHTSTKGKDYLQLAWRRCGFLLSTWPTQQMWLKVLLPVSGRRGVNFHQLIGLREVVKLSVKC